MYITIIFPISFPKQMHFFHIKLFYKFSIISQTFISYLNEVRNYWFFSVMDLFVFVFLSQKNSNFTKTARLPSTVCSAVMWLLKAATWCSSMCCWTTEPLLLICLLWQDNLGWSFCQTIVSVVILNLNYSFSTAFWNIFKCKSNVLTVVHHIITLIK